MHPGLHCIRSLPSVILCGQELISPKELGDKNATRKLLRHADGHFALATRTNGGEYLLARDPLGVHKLFFAIVNDERVVCSSYWIDLIRHGVAPHDVWSVPSGHAVEIDLRSRTLALQQLRGWVYGEGRFDDVIRAHHAAEIRTSLDRVFHALAGHCQDRPVYVALSGGLDSTVIAAMAAAHVAQVTAVTFAVAGQPESEDLQYAKRVAADLGLPFVTVRSTPAELLDLLDDVLCYGQDWRDFNVHCALVNAAIGKYLGTAHRDDNGPRPVLLTGDTMNEIMADYAPVKYDDETYYRLPKLDKGRLRRVLVSGLDAGDREVGVLAHFGVDAIQPYAFAARDYISLPDAAVMDDEAKQRLVRDVMGDEIPSYVYTRPKVRAQCGSEGVSGTLAVLADRHIGASELRARFGELFGIPEMTLSGYLCAGRYRFPTQYPSTAYAIAEPGG